MEETRNERLSLLQVSISISHLYLHLLLSLPSFLHSYQRLQAEKDLQTTKSNLLSALLSKIRTTEQRCFVLEHKNAVLNFKILAHKSEMEHLQTNYHNSEQIFRVLKVEVEAVEESEKEKEMYYEMKVSEMKEFKERVDKRVLELRQEVLEMRKCINELKSTLQDVQDNKEYRNNAEIAAAEAQKAQLLSVKENMDRTLASNYQLRAQLQKQLYNILRSQDQATGKMSEKYKALKGI